MATKLSDLAAVNGNLAVTAGGTGAASLTAHGILIGNATAAVVALAAALAGTVLAGGGAAADPAFTATPTLGIAGTTKGSLALAGNTSGTITILPQAAAGTYNFNLPTTAGPSGDILTSGGGAAAAMTWSTPTPISALTDNYNNSGTTFTSIGLTISGTSQASTSRMLRMTYNSQDQFAVDYDGAIYVYASINNAIYMYLRGNRVALISNSGATLLGGLANQSGIDNAGVSFGFVTSSKTSNYSCGLQEHFYHYDNTGATGEVDFTLPTTGTTKKGMNYFFTVTAAQTLKIVAPASVQIRVAGSNSTAAGNISSATVGDSVHIYAISATQWIAKSFVGTWTVA